MAWCKSGLKRAEHVVTLYKLSEPLVGETTVHSFELETYGKFLPPPAAQAKSLLVIGDSISTGYGNEGSDETCHFSAGTENHFFTAAARVGRELDIEVTTAAWSGRGVFSNRGSTTETTTMSSIWGTTLPGRQLNQQLSAKEWAENTPDAVLINLGTNDFAPGVEDTSPFSSAYQQLFNDVRKAYPDAAIFLSVGPLLSDAYPEGRNALSNVRGVLKAIVEESHASGDQQVYFLEFSRPKPEDGLGCDFHPSIKTQMVMAGELLSALKASTQF